MTKNFLKIGLLTCVFEIFVSINFLLAQEVPLATGSKSPIFVKWNTLGGLRYYLYGKRIEGKDLEQTVFSLRDGEATWLLKRAEDSSALGWIGVGAGGSLLVASVIGAAGSSNPNNVDPIWVATTIGGSALALGGSLFLTQAKTSEFAAVQRYNQVVRGETDMTWNQNHIPGRPMLSWKIQF